ncbi:MAG: sensor histidine kinase [Lachnospiraceae bacterium]|nr:sensor histidine kinase [Lachnospiraceae bacterium]
MIKRIKRKTLEIYNKAPLASKIRYSYILILVPLVFLVIVAFINMWSMNNKYSEMINSSVAASKFSIDFKNDFDYETYLVIVGNKKYDESGLDIMLKEAGDVVDELQKITVDKDNVRRLESVSKYLDNLATYTARIKDNVSKENLYEENMMIWENDVQIVTTLVQDTMVEFIYYDIQEVQGEREVYNARFTTFIAIVIIALIAILTAIVFFSFYIPLSISRPIQRITEVTNKVASGNLSVRSDVFDGEETKRLSTSLNAMIDKINELLDQVTTEQIRLRKAEFELLQSQINPHFLYNTLDAIVWLAESGEKEKVVSTVSSLSNFFRASLNQGKDIVTIKEDIGHVRSYLEIQQIRYQDILDYEINIPEEIYPYLIPKITIQPLVENALYHGIKNKRGKGKISITGSKQEDHVIISISDNGLGITEERLAVVLNNINNRSESEKTTYGLYNVNERIRLDFGEEYGINIDSEYGKGTTVSVKLPLNM